MVKKKQTKCWAESEIELFKSVNNDNYYIIDTEDRKICCTCCAPPIDVDYDFCIKKFRERLGLKDWDTGNCYWAATMLKNRFGGELYYDVVVGHFIVGFDDGKFYDFGGEYIPAESKNMVAWEKFEDYDPLRYERIKRDCIMNW